MNSINKSIDNDQSIDNQGKFKKEVLKYNIYFLEN